jgi:murein DD-endopeptidase MepM/ murein hydrolase activator NlpD
MLAYAAEFDVDPFLLGALAYRESRCDSNAEDLDGRGALGLTQIPRDVYAESLRGGTLRFSVLEGGAIAERTLNVDRFPFAGPRLLMAEPNVYFAAALLRMWRDQAETVNAEFEQVAHRHYVSHFIWGDRVRSDWEEERILTDRRRLLEYYGARSPYGLVDWHGVPLGCPLDGCPRAILSWLGDERDGGEREHRGIDVDSLPSEPVRAVADGFVYFAGVDLPGSLEHVQVARGGNWDAYDRDALGAGGRYVCIRHGGESMGTPTLRSCYMHLETVELAYGDTVERGALVGTVGRTGMRTSAAHLHFELHSEERLEDPSQILAGVLLGRLPAE